MALEDIFTKDVKFGDDHAIETVGIASIANDAVIVILSDELNTALVVEADNNGTVEWTKLILQTVVEELPNILDTCAVMEITSIAE